MTTILQHTQDMPYGDASPPVDATVLADGTYLVIVYVAGDDPYSDSVFLQRYATDGTALGDLVDIHAYVQYDGIRILPLANGGYAVLDNNRVDGLGGESYQADLVQFFSADGVAQSAKVGITGYTANYGVNDVDELASGNLLFTYLYGTVAHFAIYDQTGHLVINQTFRSVSAPLAAPVDGGGFVELWRGIDGKNHGQFFTAAGLAVAPAFIVGGVVNAVTGRDGGGFIMSWAEVSFVSPNYDARLMVQVYDSGGHALGAAVDAGHVGNQGGITTRIASLSDGGFIVVWQNDSVGDGDGSGIFAARFDSEGHALGQAFRVNISIAGDQYLKDVVATADGGFTVGWRGQGAEGPDLYHSIFAATTNMSGDNLLYGTSGNDSLDGRQGADIMAGGTGNDTYYVDNAGDQVQEVGGAGTDWVFSTITYTLGADVENLTLRGTADIDGSGNALDNRIGGNAGANHLFGGAGNDDLRALGGNDTLSGNSGADTMYGGAGDDLYYADDTGDRAYEILGGTDTGGIDTVRASATFNLSIYVENLILVGTADINGFGTELANTLTGNSGVNALFGMAGNDVINGGAGADRMYGGTGNDTFYVDNAGDQVFEADGEGMDIVFSSVSYATGNQYVDHITLTGTADINATGNILANRITGNAGANTLSGLAGADRLNGGAGNDTLIGGSGADVFVFSQNSGADQINDFLAVINDRIDISAYSGGVVNGGGVVISQVGDDTVIDLGGGNTVTVLHALAGDVSSHIIW